MDEREFSRSHERGLVKGSALDASITSRDNIQPLDGITETEGVGEFLKLLFKVQKSRTATEVVLFLDVVFLV